MLSITCLVWQAVLGKGGISDPLGPRSFSASCLCVGCACVCVKGGQWQEDRNGA